MILQTLSDTDLVRNLRSGSSDAFAELYLRHKDALYDYCSRLLKDGVRAEDVVQESFLMVWNDAHALNDLGSFRSWIFSIARHKALNSIRDRKIFDELHDDSSVEHDNPHAILVRNEQSALFSDLLDMIRPAYKDLIVLKDYEDFSYAEIAKVTGLSIASVRVHLFRARKALAKMYVQNVGGKK
jgi:RNA polymerase sigma-70 factor (ECF subfamily)